MHCAHSDRGDDGIRGRRSLGRGGLATSSNDMNAQADSAALPGKLRILVITRSYPAARDLYRYPFVHRRVLGYRAAGHEVAVFRPSEAEAGIYRFEGVDCTVGNGDRLGALAAAIRPNVVALHGLGPGMWPMVEPLIRSLPSVA